MTAAAARDDHDNILAGILCRVGSGFSFATMAALLKLASTHGMNAPELVFHRNLFSLPVILWWVMRRESVAALRPNSPIAHVWRSGLGILSMGLGFQALIMLPLADATAINFTAPIFATVLSFLILKEQVGIHRWVAVAVGFAGVIAVSRPGGSSLPTLGLMVAVAASLCQAGVTTTLRQIQRSENLGAIVFWFAITGIVVGGVLMPFFGQAHDMQAFALVVAAGLIGGLGQLLVTASLRAPVAAIAPFDYLQIVAATAYGWLLFSDLPTPYTIVGAALIAGSGLYTAWREHRRRIRQAATPVAAL